MIVAKNVWTLRKGGYYSCGVQMGDNIRKKEPVEG
jgi:hypothetical protein